MRAAALLALALAAGCDSAEDECIPAYEAPTCDPLYEPTFDNLHRQTLLEKCAVAGGSCHASEGAASGIVYEDPEHAWHLLLDRGLVIPNQPECSVLVHRLEADGSSSMPPGAPLSEAERCVVKLWVARGASR